MAPDANDVSTVEGMPTLGLGTWENTDPEQCAESVRTALEMGYRHVDTAQAYENEAAVGDGIARASVDREDVFLATKVDTSNLAGEDVRRTARESLDRLGVESVDLLYVHWPTNAYDPGDTLAAFQDLHEAGLIDRIGVSNFEPRNLDRAREVLDAPIFANQVEMHPLLPQRDLQTYCEDLGIAVVAYSPLARGGVFDVPEIQAVAEKHGVSEAQVSLAWLRDRGVTAIPKATSEAHVRDNVESLELDLDEEDRERIDAIEARERCVDFPGAPWNQ